MQPDSYQFLSQLLKTRSGLALTEEKTYLLESRLLPIAKHHELETIEELVHKLRFPGNNDIVEEVVDAMTTNESMFFRDIKPFEQFRKDILPQLLAANSGMRKLRIWSAACSTGQEPYSIAMCLQEEAAVLNGWNIEILATDLSPTVLEKSKSGIYTQFEVQRGLPIQMLLKYFAKEGETNWKINEKTRSMVTFKPFNLLDNFGALGKFDVVLCRNVLIYFDGPTKTQVLEKIASTLNPDGLLFLGSSETVLGLTTKFKPNEGQRGVFTVAP